MEFRRACMDVLIYIQYIFNLFVYCWFLRIKLPHPIGGLAEELGET